MNIMFKLGVMMIGLATSHITSADALKQPSQTQHSGVINPEMLTQFPQWGLVRTGHSCIEYYQFLPNGEVKIQSNQERILGRYTFLNQANVFELAAVKIDFVSDNSKPDCTGDATNQSNQSTVNYLKRKSEREIYFCDDAMGNSCPVYLRPEK